MSETKYLKCPCQKCGGSIEFPVHGIGMAVGCPHCGQKTTLFAPPVGSLLSGLPVATPMSTLPRATASERAPLPLPELSAAPDNPPPDQEAGAADTGPKRHVIRVTLLVLGLSITAGALWLVPRHKLLRARSPEPGHDSALTALKTNDPAAPATSAVVGLSPAPLTAAEGKAPKSIDDLKAGPIQLEKTKGSSLVYAVGVLRNQSGQQRFGVNIELELIDARSNKVGTAKDYRPLLEPRQEWRFRALVLDPRAVSAKVATIREEE